MENSFFTLPRIYTDFGDCKLVIFINSSETITNTFQAVHTDYQGFKKVQTSLVIWLNFQNTKGRALQKQYTPRLH